ncbi:MAG: DUF5610 domain-containing protein [Nevskiales bacterium]|nr:DUF5610 domain-containing protein [Nevskiales bacterium]
MPTSIQAVGPTQKTAQQMNRSGAEQAQAAAGQAAAAPGRDALKQQQNAAIVEASLAVSLEAGNQPLTLVLRSAIDRINELLAPELGPNAIENAAEQDFTPEATAERIVSLSTGFFDAYRRQHPELDDAAALGGFMDTIRRGFEQGFRDAEKILDGLGVLGGDIADGINRTYALVQQGYADFEAAMSQSGTATRS